MARRIDIVHGIERLRTTGAVLADGAQVDSDAIIAATGFRCGLEPLAGHLDVLDARGVPRVVGGEEAAPGLRFVGFVPLPGLLRRVGVEAQRAAREIRRRRG